MNVKPEGGIEGSTSVSVLSYSFCLRGWLEVARSANYISCFEFDLNINIIVYELVTWVAMQITAEKLFLARQNSMKTVYDLHKYSTQ